MDPRRALVALASCLVLAGCSGPSEPATTSSESTAPTTDAAERLFRLHVDHDPIASTTELAALSDIVVRGTVAGITDGAVDGGPDDAPFVIPISVVELDGTLVWPFTSVTARGTLADALPGGPLTGSER